MILVRPNYFSFYFNGELEKVLQLADESSKLLPNLNLDNKYVSMLPCSHL